MPTPNSQFAFAFALASILQGGCSDAIEPTLPTDRILWRTSGANAIGQPAVRDSTVYFMNLNHEMVALDVRTGALRWRAKSGENGYSYTLGQNVLVAGANVVFPDLALRAYDAQSGAKRWEFNPDSGRGPGAYAIWLDGNIVYAGSPSGFLHAVNADNGFALWSVRLTTDTVSTSIYYPVTDADGRVFVCVRRHTSPETDGIVAVNQSTGAVLWRREFDTVVQFGNMAVSSRPVVANGFLIAASDDGRLHGIDRSTGNDVWTAARPTFSDGIMDIRPLVVVGSSVVAGSNGHHLTAYSAANGTVVWDADANTGSIDAVASDGMRVFLTSLSTLPNLMAFDASSGQRVWAAKASDGVFHGAVTVSGEAVFVGGENGYWAVRAR